MYTFATDAIPRFLPVLEEVQLRPWFQRATIDAGLGLIREGRIGDFHTLRTSAGACIESEATVTMLFEASTKLSQGFVIRGNYCGLCGHVAQRERCAHMAALAILSLAVPSGQSHARPIPLAFAESHWAKTAGFLHAWLSHGKYTARCLRQESSYLWRITAADGELKVHIPLACQPLAERLFAGNLEGGAGVAGTDHLDRLLSELQLLSMTAGERQLAMAGSVGVAWKRDTSFWTWLARLLFVCHSGAIPELVRDPATSAFQLRLGEMDAPGAFSLVPPREKIWDIVKNIPFPEDRVKILPSARECIRVFFTDTNALEVRPSLRLQDGRVLDRQELAANRYPGVWYLPGEGFLPASRLPAEGEFRNPKRQKSSLSLLGFLQSEESKDTPFTVSPNDLPTFLNDNLQALHFVDNIVDPALLTLEVRELPDRLIIDSFEEQKDRCRLSFRYGLGDTVISLRDLREARKQKLSCLPGRQWLQLDGTSLTWFHALLDERYESGGKGRIRLSYLELFRLTALIPEVEVAVKEQGTRQHLANILDVEHWADGSLLTSIPGHLRPYQTNGLAWLLRLSRFGIGGLLADDMGLGKTHQGLALIKVLLDANPNGAILVVCPASVVLHWAGKIDAFYPDLDYGVHYGAGRDLQKAREHNIIITTYGVVRQDADQLQSVPFDLLLLDEIQNVKNPATAIHLAVAQLNSRVKIGLTGTPVENSLQDLRAIFAICLPGLLGSEREFARQYVQPITEARNSEVRERLGRLIHPFILRRNRSQVLPELPEIIEDNRLCELSGDQAMLYREVLENGSQMLAGLEDDSAAIPYMHVLATITRLKQVCCHPCLLLREVEPEAYSCGKWDLLLELSEELLAAEMKFVVFSQYVGMLELMERYFRKAGIGVAGLRGDMAAGKRQQMIERFNTDPDCRVFCASLLAGGVGIDLTGAQAVIHYDRWWNPAKEEQATARVHRMGQKKAVQVFRLITVGTLEEKIHQLLQEKRELAASLIQEDEAGIIKQLDRQHLAELFRVAPAPE